MFIIQTIVPEHDFKLVDKLNEVGLPKDSRVVDQFYSEKFMRGENGFPKSDVAMFLQTQSDDLKMQIANRLEEFKIQYPDQDLSNEEIIARTLDRNIQSAPDFQRWFSQLGDQKIDEFLQQFVSVPKTEPEKEVINFEDNKEE